MVPNVFPGVRVRYIHSCACRWMASGSRLRHRVACRVLMVPGHPGLQGRGTPIYTSIQYPFPPSPPLVPAAGCCTWYGRGPHENLAERCSAARIGIHRCAVDALSEPSVRPQDSEQRTGVRGRHLGGPDGSGLAMIADGGVKVCARRHSVEDPAAAAHQEKLPRRPWIELIIDRAHAGTGNTSQRAKRFPSAQVEPREMDCA